MTSILDSLTDTNKLAIVIDIGQAYTKCGLAGNASPNYIIPTNVLIDTEPKSVFEYESDSMIFHEDRLKKFLQSIYYTYSIINSRNRRIVIIETVITPTRFRYLLAEIFFKQFEAPSIVFLSSHLASTYTLGRSTVLVLDIGYKEAQIMPIAEGIPMAIHFDSLPYASQAIHRQLQLLLEQHALIISKGKRRSFQEAKLKLPENVLEDIKIRCCFVSPYTRAQRFAQDKTFSNSFKQAASVDYPFNSDTIIRIPGIVREFACEVLFEQDIDGRSIATLILDTLIQVPIDLRQPLANNILVIGGTAMLPGFLHRFSAELHHLVNISTYANKLATKKFRFHSPPAQLNYTAWSGGSLFGSIDTLESKSITREKYLKNPILPDWFTDKQAA